MRKLAVALLRWLAEALVRLYYPRRTVEGRSHLPLQGPALYVANHPNGLLDPLVFRVCTGHPVRFLAKSTLWGNPFGRLAMDAFRCLPVYRQQDLNKDGHGLSTSRNKDTFARCRAELAEGGEVALYPEGTSHSDPRLRPLKSGAARIVLSTAAEARKTDEGAPLPAVIPVGSHYEDKAVFRTAVHLTIGPPIDVAAPLALFASDPRTAINQLTKDISDRLSVLVLQAETQQLLAGIARVASWTADDPDDDAPSARLARTRELLAAYERMRARDPQRLETIARQARRYARTLERMGISDPWALELPRVSGARACAALLVVVVLSPLALVGWITSALPYRASGSLAARMTRDEDVLSTMKMIAGATFLVGVWLLESVAVGLIAGWPWGVALGMVAPLAGYAALRVAEMARDLAEALRHVAWRRRDTTRVRLAERRRALADQVARALRETGA